EPERARHVPVIFGGGHGLGARRSAPALRAAVVVRQQRHLLARGARLPRRRRAQPLDLALELGHVLEAAVDGRETHVRDLVETAQLLHDQIADQPARHLALAERLQVMHDPLNRLLDVLRLHRPLLQRREHAVAELRLVERLAALVALRHLRQQELGRLERREALVAGQTLAASAHLPALAGEPRVDHLRVLVIAERAVHQPYTGNRVQSSSTASRTRPIASASPRASSTSATQSPARSISARPSPRVVTAGVPSRRPRGGAPGACPGIAIRFTAMCARSSTRSAAAPAPIADDSAASSPPRSRSISTM